MGMAEQQAIVIQTVKESPLYIKILLSLIPVVGAFFLGRIGRKKEKGGWK
jgi:hypothetical protein